jgi:hypothetical protein
VKKASKFDSRNIKEVKILNFPDNIYYRENHNTLNISIGEIIGRGSYGKVYTLK